MPIGTGLRKRRIAGHAPLPWIIFLHFEVCTAQANT